MRRHTLQWRGGESKAIAIQVDCYLSVAWKGIVADNHYTQPSRAEYEPMAMRLKSNANAMAKRNISNAGAAALRSYGKAVLSGQNYEETYSALQSALSDPPLQHRNINGHEPRKSSNTDSAHSFERRSGIIPSLCGCSQTLSCKPGSFLRHDSIVQT